MHHTNICDECGNEMTISSGPGRLREYRGESGYVIPEDLEYPVCVHCGAQWMTSSQIKRLSVALEDQRAQRNALGKALATKEKNMKASLLEYVKKVFRRKKS